MGLLIVMVETTKLSYPEIVQIEGKMLQRSKNNIALVIGQGKFKSVGDLRYEDFETPENDAKAFHSFLKDSQLHFEPENLILLIDEDPKTINEAKERVN